MNDALRKQARKALGRDEEPSISPSTGDTLSLPKRSRRRVLDSQSLKTTEAGGERGYDGKKVNESKRQFWVDTNGFLLRVLVHAANISDTERAEWRCVEHFGRRRPEPAEGRRGEPAKPLNASPAETLLSEHYHCFPRMEKMRVDKGCKAGFERRLAQYTSIPLTFIEKPPEQKGCAVIPKRWAAR